MRSDDSLYIGKNLDNGRGLFLSGKERITHMHVIGSTGTGKSRFLEHMIRADILARRGLCLIDPTGALYNDILRWMPSQKSIKQDKIILFDPTQDDWTIGFNPLKQTSEDLSYQVDCMLDAVSKVWGGASLDQTPLLKKSLRLIFYALAEQKRSLYDALYFINSNETDMREFLTHNLKDIFYRGQWASYNDFKPKEYHEEFSSAINRLTEFLSSSRMRRIFGQTENTIDFQKIMDEGQILLINLSEGGNLSRLQARTLGALIVANLWLTAQRREPNKSRPFYFYIDEFSQYVTEDIGTILDKGRKLGLHLILAHQHLAQLQEEDPKVCAAVRTTARTKVVFGGLNYEDAKILSQDIFLGSFDINEVKHVLKTRSVVDYKTTVLRSRTETEGSSYSDSSSYAESQGEGASWTEEEAERYRLSEEFSKSYGGGYSETFSHSVSEGKNEALMPVIGEQVSSVQFRSLEEQLHRAMAVMVNQPTQFCLVKKPDNKDVFAIKTPMVKEGYANPERVGRYKDQVCSTVNFIKPVAEVDKEIEKSTQLLKEGLKDFLSNKNKQSVKAYKKDKVISEEEPEDPF